MGKRYVRITSNVGNFFTVGEVVHLREEAVDELSNGSKLYEASNGEIMQLIESYEFEEMRGDK